MLVWEGKSEVPGTKSRKQEPMTNRPTYGVALGFEPRPQRKERVCAAPILLSKLDKSCFRKLFQWSKHGISKQTNWSQFLSPRRTHFFLRHLVRETRGSSHKDKRRGDLGKGMNRDLLARPYVSPNLLASTADRSFLDELNWNQQKLNVSKNRKLKMKKQKIWNCWQEAHARALVDYKMYQKSLVFLCYQHLSTVSSSFRFRYRPQTPLSIVPSL